MKFDQAGTTVELVSSMNKANNAMIFSTVWVIFYDSFTTFKFPFVVPIDVTQLERTCQALFACHMNKVHDFHLIKCVLLCMYVVPMV